MPFARETQIGYADCDFTRRLRLSSAMRMMEETSSEHLRSIGVSNEQLRAQKLVFLLVKSCIRMHRMPVQGEPVQVLTAPVATKGVRFVREFAIDAPGGERLVSAHTLWVLADTEEHKVLRPRSFPHPIELHASFLDGAVGDEPIRCEPSGEWLDELVQPVCYSHLDINRHVNNSVYADFALNALPLDRAAGGTLDLAIIHFQHEARHGDSVRMQAHEMENNAYYIQGMIAQSACFEANLSFR